MLYYDNDSTDGVTGCCLKADAMLGLERFEDTVSELEQYISSMKGKGVDLDDVKEKLDEAKMLLKKSKRKDLYKVLGVTKGALATTAEIKTAYKKAALKWVSSFIHSFIASSVVVFTRKLPILFGNELSFP